MQISKENNIFYEIELRVSKYQEAFKGHDNLLEGQNMPHIITKHPKEINTFLKYLLKQLKSFKGHVGWSDVNSETYIADVEYLNQLAIANLTDLREGIYHSISILNTIDNKKFWMDDQIVNFFEISMFNFYKTTNVHHILKQGFICKKAGGRPSKNYCMCACLRPMQSSRKWFILTNQFLCYVEKPFPAEQSQQQIQDFEEKIVIRRIQNPDPTQSTINKDNGDDDFLLKEVMLIDSLWQFTVKKGLNETKININTNNRVLSLKFKDFNFKSWLQKISSAIDNSPWSQKLERFVESSFAPTRKKNTVKLMIDGESFFRNVADELQKAQFEIFITDWWLCPKYYLAQRGVNIYILHWRESKFAVNFNSLITKQYLQGLHPNIKMARHSGGAIQLWSHHAKLVIVDQMVAFVGGMDICYGRWDTRNHPLHDIGIKESEQCLYPGNDYCNEKQKALVNTEDLRYNTLDREKEVRMPFHDTAVCIEGDTATDLSHHFVHLWNNAKLDKHGKRAKIASITTHTKYRGLFRKAFKKMKAGSSTGVVSLGYPDRDERKRQKGILKEMKSKSNEQQNKRFEQRNYEPNEDQKFDEGLEGIIQKQLNFQSFKDMNRIKSPNKLSNLNNTGVRGKFQNIIGLLKTKPTSQQISKNIVVAQTPKSSNKSIENFADSQIITGFKAQDHPDFYTPMKNGGISSKMEFEKSAKLIPASGIQASVGKESDREDQVHFYMNGADHHQDNALQDSAIILHKSHTIPQQSIEAINVDDNDSSAIKNSLFEEEEKQMQRDQIIEMSLDQNQQQQNDRKSQGRNYMKKYRTQDEIPYVRTEEVQILMHSPFKKRQYMQDQSPKLKEEEKEDGIKTHQKYLSIKRNLIASFHAHGEIYYDDKIDHPLYNNCTIQALRSASPWSLGLLQVEHSIYEAYIQLIEQSQKFIYIENQFFITQSILYERNKRNVVKNKIGLALRERILRAHRHKEDFFIMIFVPLLPAFSGDILDSSSSILRIQVNYQMKSMGKGKRSLVELLKSDGIEDPWQYIKFFSLRAHSQMPTNQMPQTEMIYIHSKAMIVDDQHIIIGSANINDRSMLGSRDHEIGVVISQTEPEDLMEVQINGKQMKVSRLAHTFRTELMMEHFGLPYEKIADPILQRENLKDHAQKNTNLFFEIFKCEPDETISTFAELQEARDIRAKEQENQLEFTTKYQMLSDQIIGHVVNYPVFFLKDENLGQNFLNSEILVPEITFV